MNPFPYRAFVLGLGWDQLFNFRKVDIMHIYKMIIAGFLLVFLGCEERTFVISNEDDFINYSSCNAYHSQYMTCLESAQTPSDIDDCEKIDALYKICVSATPDTDTATESLSQDTSSL